MAEEIANVLFLCTGNSARSIIVEAILNHLGHGQFRGYSAGSHPKGLVHPMALALIHEFGIPTQNLCSKSWDEFARPGAPEMSYIVTVCDNAAGEVCPVWPGRPIAAHWGLPDPAAVTGPLSVQEVAFRKAFRILEARIRFFLALPLASLTPEALKRELKAAGSIQPAAAHA